MSQKATLISKDELNTSFLMEVFRQAFMDPHLDADGDFYITIDRISIYAQIDNGNGTLRIYSAFGVQPQTSRQQVIELSNRINDGLIFIRACCPSTGQMRLLLDHYIDTNAGVTALEVVDEFRRFRTVITSIPPLDSAGICG